MRLANEQNGGVSRRLFRLDTVPLEAGVAMAPVSAGRRRPLRIAYEPGKLGELGEAALQIGARLRQGLIDQRRLGRLGGDPRHRLAAVPAVGDRAREGERVLRLARRDPVRLAAPEGGLR
jgi:hypothetical protein